MINYQGEESFVKSFAKDIKNESEFCVNGKTFAAKYAGKNDSKQSIYSVTIDGEVKKLNITQLKKRLGVTWTSERANSGESAGTTKFVEKTDEELAETAVNACGSIFETFAKAVKLCGKYGLSLDDVVAYYKYDNKSSMIDAIVGLLKTRQAEALAARAEKAAKAEADKKQRLQAKLAELQKMGLSKDDILAMLG